LRKPAAANPQAVFLRRARHGCEAVDAFRDAAIDVLLRKRFAGRAENHDLVGARGERAFEAAHVRRQHRVDRAWAPFDTGHDVGAVGHLRHPFRRDERRRFDVAKTRRRQAVDQLDLDRRGDEFFFVLQPVTRTDFDDFHLLR